MRIETMIAGQSFPKPALCDCGHPPTPDTYSTGYAERRDGSTVCYACAADIDRAYAAGMQQGDAPLFAYVRPWPSPDGARRVEIVTWPGVKLGYGFQGQASKWVTRAHVEAWIDGRRFWGWTPTETGDYVALRPYKGQ